MATKSRHLIVLQYLRENSDVDHYVSSVEILKKLKEEGFDVDVRTLRNDIASLQATGYTIHVDSIKGRPALYAWDSRPLSLPELQILVDAVPSSRFLTVDKSNEIISKLVKLSGPSGRDLLKPEFLVSEQAKAPNNEYLFIVQTIQKAIDTNRKITFRYMQYHLVPKKEGEGFGTGGRPFFVPLLPCRPGMEHWILWHHLKPELRNPENFLSRIEPDAGGHHCCPDERLDIKGPFTVNFID